MDKILNKKDNLIKNIEEKIREGKVKMKPKWFFVFKGIIMISFVFILLLSAIYLGNFILLIFHEHRTVVDSLGLNPFDVRKLLDFIKLIPIILVALILLFVFSSYRLIKDYAFIYRKNFVYVIFALLILVFAVVINFHLFLDRDFRFAKFGERGEIPFLQDVHKYYRPDFMPREMNIGNFPVDNRGPRIRH